MKTFGIINYSVLAAYFLVLLWIGFYFSKRQKSTEDYFKGQGRVPWWAAGIIIFGTLLSAITFMAIPAKVYDTDWSYFLYSLTVILLIPLISSVFIPFYNRLNITSAYEYLEKRFNVLARMLGSLSFIVFLLTWLAVQANASHVNKLPESELSHSVQLATIRSSPGCSIQTATTNSSFAPGRTSMLGRPSRRALAAPGGLRPAAS